MRVGGVIVLIGSASESSEQEGTAHDAKLKLPEALIKALK